MKRRLAVVLLLITPLLLTAPASASQYELFGNGWNADCTFASLANLVRYNWPSAPITADQVLSAWTAQPQDPFGYMITTGFAGHRISDYAEHTTATRPLITRALAHGGMVAWLNLPMYGPHAETVVGVNAHGVLSVVAPGVLGPNQLNPHLTLWPVWKRELTGAFTVTWLLPSEVAVDLVDMASTITASFVVSPGQPVTIPPSSPPSPGPQFAFCGWSITPGAPHVVYAPGSSVSFTTSTVLGPVFFLASEGCTAWASQSQ